MTEKSNEDYDAEMSRIRKRLQENEAAFEREKYTYDDFKRANLRKLVEYDRCLLRDLSQKRAASRPAGADNRRGSSAIFYGSNS